LEIAGMSVMLNINITLYIKDDLNYKYYYKFEGSDLPNDNINILFIIDHFSKYMNSFLLKNKSMISVITKIKLFINNNGKCKLLQSDNGKEFDNREMYIFCKNEDIKYIKSAPYHPQTNWAVEIVLKTEQTYLEKRKK